MMRRHLLVSALIVAVALSWSGSAIADFDGDGADEIGAFAVEVAGAARGNWVQVVDTTGTPLLSKFFLSGFVNVQNLTTNLNGAVGDELVTLATNPSTGRAILQARDNTGALIDQALLPLGFSDHKLFEVNFDGGGATEVGVGFSSDATGASVLQIFKLVSGNLVEQFSPPHVLLGTGFTPVDWQAGDLDADGNEEIVEAFSRDSDGFLGFRSFDPQTTTNLGTVFVAGTVFTNVQFLVDDVFGGDAGDDVLVGLTVAANNAAFFRVFDEAGNREIQSRGLPPGFLSHTWKTISNGTVRLVLLGSTNGTTDNKLFKVINGNNGTALTTKAVGFVDSTVVDWLSGNFDGVAGNGEEVAVTVLRDNGFTAFQIWNRAGTSQLAFRSPFGSSFINPQVLVIDSGIRDDLMVGAKFAGGAPVVTVWSGAGTELLRQSIFNGDVV